MTSRNRGPEKPSLRNLGRIPPTLEEREEIRNALPRESPIATAILGASLAEHELETELRASFRRSNDDTWKAITSDNGPLGTFNQKIIAAHGLGIIDEVIRDALNSVRNIRNAFAHTKRILNFNNELIEKALKTVTLPSRKRSKLYKDIAEVRRMKDRQTGYAMLCIVICISLLERRTKRSKAKSYARLRALRRSQALSNALHRTPSSRRLGLLGLLGGYQNADPKKTILGEAALSGRDLAGGVDDKTDT